MTSRTGFAARLTLGRRQFDLSHRALVMGILNRTPDSFSERGKYFALDDLLARAEEIVGQGADILDVGGVKAGPGPEVSVEEELDRVVPVVAALVSRFDLPVSVDTWSATVLRESCASGAVLGNDISGFGDTDYLAVAAECRASVVATHIRLAPRVPDPDPRYDDVVSSVRERLSALAARARAAGIDADRIVLDAGLDLGKTAEQSLQLLRASGKMAALGYPLLLSASNKTFLGALLDLEIDQRREASLAAAALGIAAGARLVRVHDVRGTRRVADTLAEILGRGAP